MKKVEGQIKTEDHFTLYAQSWMPDDSPRAMLAFVHGGGEHTGRYEHFAQSLADAGYGVYMADLRGHGKSPGARGHIMAWEDYLHDASAIVTGARDCAPDVPRFLGGHSLGGLIALSAAVSNPPDIRGVIVSSPFLGVAWDPPAWKLTLARLFSSAMPRFQMSTNLETDGLSHDPVIIAAYQHDPLVHDQVSTRGTMEILKAQQDTLIRAEQVRLPLLVMYGSDDPIASPAPVEAFFERAASTDKTCLRYEGLYHEIFNEPEKAEIIAQAIAWMDARL